MLSGIGQAAADMQQLTTREQGNIERGLKQLGAGVDHLEGLVDTLTNRLSAVTQPRPPSGAGGGSVKAQPLSSPLADIVTSQGDRIANINVKISALMSALEL